MEVNDGRLHTDLNKGHYIYLTQEKSVEGT